MFIPADDILFFCREKSFQMKPLSDLMHTAIKFYLTMHRSMQKSFKISLLFILIVTAHCDTTHSVVLLHQLTWWHYVSNHVCNHGDLYHLRMINCSLDVFGKQCHLIVYCLLITSGAGKKICTSLSDVK